MISALTLVELTLMPRENMIKVNIHFMKHASFKNFGENKKDSTKNVIFDIKFALLVTNKYS